MTNTPVILNRFSADLNTQLRVGGAPILGVEGSIAAVKIMFHMRLPFKRPLHPVAAGSCASCSAYRFMRIALHIRKSCSVFLSGSRYLIGVECERLL